MIVVQRIDDSPGDKLTVDVTLIQNYSLDFSEAFNPSSH